ncbi:hypothetical protein ACQRET_00225 [Streptomyces koyangensis]|uniref:hypothetical protein n=1 Tax=Streptomyces koyangensis TaxID=188770 RepID=UPI003D008828
MTPGWELAGIVVASRAPGFAPGDRVLAMSAQIATGLGTWANWPPRPSGCWPRRRPRRRAGLPGKVVLLF